MSDQEFWANQQTLEDRIIRLEWMIRMLILLELEREGSTALERIKAGEFGFAFENEWINHEIN